MNKDTQIFDVIESSLKASGTFAKVIVGVDPSKVRTGANDTPLAIVYKTRFNDQIISCNPLDYERTVAYTITIEHRDEDEYARDTILNQCEAIVQNLFDKVSLGSLTCPDKSGLTAGGETADRRSHPSKRITLLGEFVYIFSAGSRPT